MTKLILPSWFRVGVAVFGAATLCASAFADPRDHRDDRHDDHHDDRRDHYPAPPATPVAVAPPAGRVAVAPPADPALAARLEADEARREADRRARMRDEHAWDASRADRAAQHRNEVTNTWGNAVNTPAGQAELSAHADRMARLNRILDVANQKGDTALASRCQNDINREVARDARVMQQIRMGGAR
jgi:hypothetical protein